MISFSLAFASGGRSRICLTRDSTSGAGLAAISSCHWLASAFSAGSVNTWASAWRSAATRSGGTSGATASGFPICDGRLTPRMSCRASSVWASDSAGGVFASHGCLGVSLPIATSTWAAGGDCSNQVCAVTLIESQVQQAPSTSFRSTATRLCDVPL